MLYVLPLRKGSLSSLYEVVDLRDSLHVGELIPTAYAVG